MKISQYYREVLGANLKNQQWSWGATNPLTNQLFLRVWTDEIKVINGQECILVLNHIAGKSSNGYPEREQHLADCKNGADCYGVLCVAKDPQAKTRTIKSFDRDMLLKLGNPIYLDDAVYAPILGKVPARDVAKIQSSESTLLPDIKSILSKSDKTTKEILANARIGQGPFRARVLAMWESKCCVTGVYTSDVLRASHIKPWRLSTDSERLDPNNGLPLVATLDALFDPGLISFSEEGHLLISPKLCRTDVDILGLDGLRLREKPTAKTLQFLSYHQARIFIAQ